MIGEMKPRMTMSLEKENQGRAQLISFSSPALYAQPDVSAPWSEQELQAVPEEWREPLRSYGELFVNRWDIHAIQRRDGSYVCVRQPLTHEMLWRHILGEVSLGVYALDQESRGRWSAFDADDDGGWKGLISLSTQLAERSIPSYLEHSRRGGHLWLFMEDSLSGKTLRAFGRELLSWVNATVEIFPKSNQNKGGPGSLIRLPLGIHRRSRKRYPFVDSDGHTLGANVREQLKVLAEARRVPTGCVAEVLGEALSSAREATSVPARPASDGERTGVIERLKRIDLFTFISAYVELTPSGRGHCPFHDDEHMSFSVNREGNYWNCFAGCGGGDIINFWEKWRRISRREAIQELTCIDRSMSAPEAQ